MDDRLSCVRCLFRVDLQKARWASRSPVIALMLSKRSASSLSPVQGEVPVLRAVEDMCLQLALELLLHVEQLEPDIVA